MTSRLSLPRSCHEEMVAHAEEAFPHECCGILLGTGTSAGERSVVRVQRGRNTQTERPERRFDLDPADLLAADGWARENDCDIVGFYHSHPDHPADPSETDRRWAEPWGETYSHVILSVLSHRYDVGRSWVLVGDHFEEQPIEIVST